MAKVQVAMKPLERTQIQLVLVGDTPLLVHKWSEKAKQQIRDKKEKKAKKARPVHSPKEEFENSMYPHPDGGHGFQSIAVKKLLINTAHTHVDSIKKTQVVAIQVHGEKDGDIGELCRIWSPEPPVMREDPVRLSGPGNPADLRYRAEYHDWYTRVNVSFLPSFSVEQVLNLFQVGGFAVGLLEYRVGKGGRHGAFHIADEEELKRLSFD